MADERAPVGGPRAGGPAVDRSEGFGERLLGALLDRAHEMPPQLIAPLVAEEVKLIGGRDVTVLLQDYDQQTLMPLPGEGLQVGDPEPIDGSFAGRAFRSDGAVERPTDDGVRLFLPLLDGTDRVGVMSFTLDTVDDDGRRLARRMAGLVADMLVTKGMYTDRFFQARRNRPMSLAAELLWSLLPPLTMTSPQVSLAGILEPAYQVGGDTFDYALNDDVLHVGIIDAMGHGLEAALLATLAVGAYRHARRAEARLTELYAGLDTAIAEQFGPDRFVTAQLARLDTGSGHLQWVNAGHPAPLLIRGRRVVATLDSPTTLPAGLGGDTPQISELALEPGDRVLLFTDGIVEERRSGGEQFGHARLVDVLERAGQSLSVQETVRRLSHTLMRERGGATSDDATLVMFEWRGGSAHHLLTLGEASAGHRRNAPGR